MQNRITQYQQIPRAVDDAPLKPATRLARQVELSGEYMRGRHARGDYERFDADRSATVRGAFVGLIVGGWLGWLAGLAVGRMF